jgi:hypothetical protein
MNDWWMDGLTDRLMGEQILMIGVPYVKNTYINANAGLNENPMLGMSVT